MATALEEMKAACRMSDEAIKERESVLFELANFQPLPRPSRAHPWLLAPALALAFAAGVWAGGWLL
jgi:hypothetical protein